MYVTAIVKGDRHVAALAASARGIPATCVRETRGERETILRVPGDFWGDVARWFNEAAPCERGEGFPVGTCLLFSSHDEEKDGALLHARQKSERLTTAGKPN